MTRCHRLACTSASHKYTVKDNTMKSVSIWCHGEESVVQITVACRLKSRHNNLEPPLAFQVVTGAIALTAQQGPSNHPTPSTDRLHSAAALRPTHNELQQQAGRAKNPTNKP